MHAMRKRAAAPLWKSMPRGAPSSPRLSCAVSVFLVCLCGCFDASSVRHMPTQHTYSQQTSSREQKGSLMKYGRMRGGSFVPQLFFDPSEGSDCDPAVFDWSGIEASRRQRLRLRGGFDNAQWNGEDIGTDSALGYHKLPKQGSESSESSSDDEAPAASSSSVSEINEEELRHRREHLEEEEGRLAQDRYVEELKRADEDRKSYELESAFSMPTAEEEAEEDKRERELADIITESQIPSGVDDDDEDDGHAHAASAAAQPTKLQQDEGGLGEAEGGAVKKAKIATVRMGSNEDRRALPKHFSDRWMRSPRPEAEKHQIPGAVYSDLKLALAGVKGHGTELHLSAGEHGPFLVEHDYPEEADHETEVPSTAEKGGEGDMSFRVWADPLYMLVPCHLIGTPSTRLHGSISIVCGTIGVGPCRISDLSWTVHRESCLHIFGGQWQLSECDMRTNHPAGDAIFCRGTSKIPLPRRRRRETDSAPAPLKFAKFPLVTLHLEKCGLGGMRAGVPAGWGVMVVERAEMEMRHCKVEFTHQAIGVVDWSSAFVASSSLVHNGNALWFGNKCDVQMSNCEIREVLAAFSLRNMWDRGTKCCDTAQDKDDGRRAKLGLYKCKVSSPLPVFEGKRVPGTFTNQSCTFTVPETTIESSSVRPALPYIKDPFTYHMKNLNRDDLSGIKTFGADPRLRRPNPAFREKEGEGDDAKGEVPRGRFQELNKHAADLAEEGPFKDPQPVTYSIL